MSVLKQNAHFFGNTVRNDGGGDDHTILNQLSQTMRFLTDESGHILYFTLTPQFHVKDSHENLAGRHILDVLNFTDFASLFLHSPDFGLSHKKDGLSAGNFHNLIKMGVHEVIDHHHESSCIIHTQIFTLDNRRSFLLFSNTEESQQELEKKIFKTLLQNIPVDYDKDMSQTYKKGDYMHDTVELVHFLNMAHEMMLVTHFNGDVLRVNAVFNEITEYSDHDILHASLVDLIADDEKMAFQKFLDQVTHASPSMDAIESTHRLLTKSRQERWVKWRFKKRGGLLYGVGLDMTQQKKSEATLKQQAELLSEAQAIGHMGHWRWQIGNQVIDWSDELYRIFDVDRLTFKPTFDNINTLLHRRDLGRLMQTFQRAMIEKNNYEVEFRIIRANGE